MLHIAGTFKKATVSK